jgi:hypothetical protein
VGGLLGRVPAGQVERLRRERRGVRAVLDANRPLHLQGVAAALPDAAAATVGFPAVAAAVPGAWRGVAVVVLDSPATGRCGCGCGATAAGPRRR